MKLIELARVVNGQLNISSAAEHECFSVSIDSRAIAPGALFVAIRGPKFDGHDFLALAHKNGAVVGLVDHFIETIPLPQIQVTDTLQALQTLSAHVRAAFSIPVIALTGSCGKTTTKQFIAQILSSQAPVLATEGTLNNHFGVPLTLLRLKSEHQFAVIEIGANHGGEIAQLVPLVKPTVALITNVAPVHLEGFGSLDGIAKAKAEIFQGLPANGLAICPRDDAYYPFWNTLLGQTPCLTFGRSPEADIRAEAIELDPQGCARFRLVTPNNAIQVQLNLMGEHNVLNALAAAAAAYSQNVDIAAIAEGLSNMQAVPRRLVRKKGIQGITIIDDSYNANPQSMLAALQVLRASAHPQILVVGDMLELGPDTVHFHEQLGEQARLLGIDALYCFGELTAHTASAFGASALHFTKQEALIQALRSALLSNASLKNATLLVKGSNGMAMWKVGEALQEAVSDNVLG